MFYTALGDISGALAVQIPVNGQLRDLAADDHRCRVALSAGPRGAA